MPYFFSVNNLTPGAVAEVVGDEMRHLLLSHRAKPGERVKLQGPDGKRYRAELVRVDKKNCFFKVLEQIPIPAEPKAELVLFQAVIAEKALDLVLQKATELGVVRVVLFNSKNVPAILSAEKFSHKKEMWERILSESAKQSERGVLPKLSLAADFKDLLGLLGQLEHVFLLDAGGQAPENFAAADGLGVGLVVGPEGGFAPEEIEVFRTLPNLLVWSLGNFVLRSDTAATGGLAVLRTFMGS